MIDQLDSLFPTLEVVVLGNNPEFFLFPFNSIKFSTKGDLWFKSSYHFPNFGLCCLLTLGHRWTN